MKEPEKRDGYATVEERSRREIVIQRSRFIGECAPVHSPEEAARFVESVKKAMPDASHHCYAYVVGKNRGVQRSTDDGEPSGTAGVPILQVLNMNELTDVALVVTRYFGGVLLGAKGLVRAYSRSAAEAVKAARPVFMEATDLLSLTVDYPLWGKLEYELKAQPVKVAEVIYASDVTVNLKVRKRDRAAFVDRIVNRTEGRVRLAEGESEHLPWEIEID
ncbi:YigZ family protein [Gehongia tenuis]|uniref:YigZ family protein n=1 Tax=Gehongia tenuis TaxID=2763655 RepID=A0A926HQ66_9FIRM|nr:YigZ family protein [Gehongia tenuis]MBC8531425.1 YigZ family protein [Gehongia tenuis]